MILTRNIEIIVYNQELLMGIIEKAKVHSMEYAWIYHDKDIYETGEVKKPHYHVQLFSEHQKTLENWAEFYGVPQNMVEKIKNKPSAIRYLTHCDNNEKYQYQIENIITNMDIIKYFKNTISSEQNEIELIYLHITQNRRNITYKDLWDFVIDNDLWSTYRRNYSIIKDLLYDHNLVFTNRK